MARIYFPGIVHRNASGFGINFPDLPGCISGGDTLAGCLSNAEEAVTLYVEEMAKDGKQVPYPNLDELELLRQHQDEEGFVTVQFIPAMLPAKAVRLTISMDEELVKRIDAAAGHYGRSGWLAAAAREKLKAG